MNASIRRLSTLIPSLVILSACAGANMTSYTPVHEKTKFKEDVLFRASRHAVEKLGIKLNTADGVAHTVDTREREVAISSIPRLSYKYSFHIETTGGVLSIEAKCTQNTASKEAEYKDCGDDRPKAVIREQEELTKKTLELAPTEEDTSVDWSNYGKEPPPEPADSAEKPKPKPKTGDNKKKAESGGTGAAPAAAKPENKADKKSDDYIP